MRLMGDTNWWMPAWSRTVLRLPTAPKVIRLPDAVPAQRSAAIPPSTVIIDD